MFDHLCDELIGEIFEKLPVKSILRLRSLSKSWCVRIDSPDFIRRYNHRIMKSPQKVLIKHVMIYDQTETDKKESIYTLHSKDRLPLYTRFGYEGIAAVKFPFANMEIVGSCNGIICLNNRIRFMLWNFSIRRQQKIEPNNHLRYGVSTIALGFGFDSITHDYKIVGVYRYEAGNRSYLYSMKTGSWIEIASPTTTCFSLKSKACLINGTLHWVVRGDYDLTELSTIGWRSRVILTFNLSTHVFGMISLPEPRWTTKNVSIINGSLAVISSNNDNTKIWMRREYDNIEPWTQIADLNKNELNGARILKSITNDDLLISTDNFWFQVDNAKTGVLLRLWKFEDSVCKVEMETYVESLELLDRETACGETITWNNEGCRKRHKKKKRRLSVFDASKSD